MLHYLKTLQKIAFGIVYFCALISISSSAHSSIVIYDNGNPKQIADSWPRNDVWQSEAYDSRPGADFILSSENHEIGGIRWWGGFCCRGYTSQDDFSLSIYEIQANTPSIVPLISMTLPAVSLSATGLYAARVNEIYEYTAMIPEEISLTPGVRYLLSITNNTPDDIQWWGWSESTKDGPIWFLNYQGSAWYSYNTEEVAFQLLAPDNNIPEPTTLALIGIALGGMTANRRKRIKAA